MTSGGTPEARLAIRLLLVAWLAGAFGDQISPSAPLSNIPPSLDQHTQPPEELEQNDGSSSPSYIAKPLELKFKHHLYNVSISENSPGKTYALQPPGEDKLGIQVDIDHPLDIRYKIISGDRDKFFKAEERLVGDFSFLTIRTRTGNNDVLNRERKDKYVLEVRASATKREGKNKIVLEDDATVVVTVLDTNDLNPLFYPTEYSVTIDEDTSIHTSILKVVAEDADLGRNGEIYYSFLENTDQFAIHPTSGVITLTRPLTFSEMSLHVLTVLGVDRGGSSRSGQASKAKVKIRVRQVNLYVPEIYVHALPDLLENSSAVIYAIVRVVDKDSGIHGEIKSLDIVDGDPDGHFRIRATSQPGEYNIEVHRLLDRETTPQGYNLTLRATDKGTPQRQSYKVVPVHLSDVNDNAPIFMREIYEVSVPETAPINTPVIRLKVTDPDEGKNAQVFLEIVGGNEGGEFRINPDTGMLYTAVTLDAELKAFYTLTVSAIDQGNTGTRKQSSAKVKINVQDTNDNDPIFENPNMTVWADENEPTGTTITKVTARDKDSGENAYISYSIANLNEVPFDIDHFSGIVRTTQILDYESMRREHILRVRASDWGLPYRRQTEMQLIIKVRDVNDNRPQFERVDCVGHVPRYVPIGSEVITLSAIDFDAGNIISYRLVSGNEDGCFPLDSISGVISVGCDLKDIRVDQREVNVTATDGTHFADVVRVQIHLVNAKRNLGSMGRLLNDETGAFECRDTGVVRRSTEILAAAEKNNMPAKDAATREFGMMPSRYGENIHAPEFVDFPVEIKVNESVALGTTLVKLKARDRDLGYNGKLIYGISSGDNDSAFRLDPDTGELKLIGYLDRERENEYLLNVSVYDLGKPQKSLSRILPITVLDVNDNAPKFEKSLASFRVTENALNGTAIFRVNATDADLGDNAKVKYSLVTDTKDFSVDSETGVLSVSASLDRERQEVYELKIRATDGGGKGDVPALYSDALVRITIDDINDNAPAFSLSNYVVRVREDIPKGTVVAVVSATDPDLGPGGEIIYSLAEDGDGEGAFKIDKKSGTIRTAKLLDFEERQVHSLTVQARDRGVPELSSETSVIVEIVDVNENRFAPEFNDFVLTGSVMENQPVGAFVMDIKATDADLPGPDSRVVYSIRGGTGLGLFSIDAKDGAVKTLAVLDVESTPHYWLTVCAQDQAVVPLHSCIEVFIQVLNENDNVPLTEQAAYYPSVIENSPPGTSVLQLTATDLDADSNNRLSYKITSGNPEGFFAINTTSGLITTTARRLDRENQAEHILEVMVSDNGSPPFSSTSRVVVTVQDINDHAPEFEQHSYTVQIPASAVIDQALFQNQSVTSQSVTGSGDSDLILDEGGTWEIFSIDDLPGDPILRVLAIDNDIGENGRVTYSIKSGKGKNKFRIHPDTGVVYAQKAFEVGQEYDLSIKATDNGTPPKAHIAFISVQVIAVPADSSHPPHIRTPDFVQVTENDEPRYLVTLIQASDQDQSMVWYDIVGGDERNEFYIGHEKGNVLLAKQLDWETQNEYNLTIAVTDGVHTTHTQLYVTVIDVNDHRPEFTQDTYKVDISEDVEAGTEILHLLASDKDEDKKLYYSLHAARNPASLNMFKVDSVTGVVSLIEKLDREMIDEHVLTVIVKDQGTPAKRNYARVIVTVHDHNDHAPEFTTKIIEGKIYETSSVGSSVVQVYAVDRDKGDNAKITYSITSGNVGNVFTIDPEMGNIQIARELDLNTASEYILHVKATDAGRPPLFSTIPVHIMVVMADNAPPRFKELEPAAEIYENQPIGTYVIHLNARSTSSLLYQIIEGNTDDMFFINPSTGVITTKDQLDYERNKFYNLSVTATNMASSTANCRVLVHVLDKNDNAPYFVQAVYKGMISEAAHIGSLVLTNSSTPLVIKARDLDSELNALLNYDIVEALPRKYFHIDSSTGAIKTVMNLDHETYPEYSFHVKVSDLGKPRLSSDTTAKVEITVTDVNDCPPKFTQSEYNVTLLLPTYENVAVLQVNASDPDSQENTTLRFDIIEGNKDKIFSINSENGIITTTDSEKINSFYRLHIRVSDGKFSSVAHVNIRVETSENSGLVFQKSIYEGSIQENSTKITTVVVVNVLGSSLNEHILFTILNPTDMFTIGSTSGAIETTGIRFDREVKDNYELIVEARSHLPDREKPRVAHVIVNVTVVDINDNCPMFVNLPYYAVVSVDDPKGQVITKVHAIDMDSFENGEVRYEMKKGHGELFKVCRKTGEVSLKQNLEGHNREYELIIGAYDGGITPCSTEVTVHVKVIDRSMPIFDKQFYSDIVPENIELHSPLGVSIQAESPLGRKLIYSIVKGNELEEFALDFNTAPDSTNGPCAIYVVDELDYEQRRQYELTVRATDSVSGVFAEVLVSVLVQDVNDCPPEFSQDSYNISISESEPFGTAVLKVSARDNDTGLNQVIQYAIQSDSSNSSEYFHMDSTEGIIYLKKSLDHELFDSHHFTVIATDKGVPSLSSTAHVWVTVLDMNDNPPKFEQPSYTCFLSQHATRGQFVTIVTASDPDYVNHDGLTYTIVGGNELQTFSINPVTGIINLVNMQNFAENAMNVLNISVTDGVYTSFTRVKIIILPANLNNPVFPHILYEVKVNENQLAGRLVTTVTATDKDFGEYGSLSYTIYSDEMQEIFSIDKIKGEILTKVKLDRESRKVYEIPIMATDGGGKSGFMTVRVKVGDVNDNTPEFALREYKASIHSNNAINTTFIKVKATDLDDDLAGKIQYSIYDAQNSGVKELFGINSVNGGVSLLKNAGTWENQMFQFFIRAEDQGTPPLHSDVPISVYIMSSSDHPPVFERKEDKFFLSENSPPGTIITRLKMVTNVTALYQIISGNSDTPQFAIDQTGQLTLARSLDRELKDSHLIGILAETDSSPPLTALAEVLLKVLDENDHGPIFESNPYTLNLAENTDEGTPILKVSAHDADQGSNGDVRYAFSSDIGELANVFAIDSFTGWITTLVELDKEKKSDYKFQVIATDNGNPKHHARTTVNIKLKDYNDSPPEFKSKFYKASVNEDALPGTVVVQLGTSDLDSDLNTPIEYYITSGDILSQFQIRQTGEVFVAKPLDRESISNYDLSVIATDGKYTALTNVSIDILDANDNPPYCLRYRYREVLSEGSHPGSYVLSVLANDIDEEFNSKLRYYLTGHGSDKFILDKDNGHMKTARPLDREKQSRYQLTAHVQDKDRAGWECSSQIEIVISDLNDNTPQFSMSSYSVTLPEDVEVGTLVTKVHATDEDIGINRKIKYSFLDSANDHFVIANDSGIVTLAKPLDRELKAMYNLTVQASDQGTPQLSSTASLIVNVQDINDNPPEFATKYYYATVPEINAVGSEVVHVLATSKDTGVNADVYYSIVGGNEHKKFNISSRTGAITIAEMLDYERAKDYFLTIQAIDGGIPPLSNLATVNITVTDSNDNAPIFNQASYSARIREDAQIGDKILQVSAHDLDSDNNGKVSYIISRGDRHNQFTIDEDTGYISVASELDRETTSNYVLEVHAKDNGLPVMTSFVMVNVEISDANDNPPIFTKLNYTAIVQEDKPIGHAILKFEIKDADTFPNAAPYTFDFRSGNEPRVFRIEQDGILRTAAKFNHKIKDNYLLQIRVFDNGTPPLYSDTWVVVKVIEESQYPPVITPLEISVNSYLDEYPGGVIGKVFANDQDPYDSLSFALNPTAGVLYYPNDLFNLSKSDGTLHALPGLDIGDYRVNVSVTDGKFTTHTIIKVFVELISEEMLLNSVVVRFREVSPQEFVLSHRKGFVRSVRNAMNSRLKDVVIISVQPSIDDSVNIIQHSRSARESFNNSTILNRKRRHVNTDLDVLFTVRKSQVTSLSSPYFTSDSIRKALNDNLEELEESTKLVVEEIVRFKCTSNYCKYGECRDKITLNSKDITPISTEFISFVSAKHNHRMECVCKEGYDGERCETIVNECARDPCASFKVCIPDASLQGYSCQCSEGFAGSSCEIDMSKCHDESCYIPRNPVSFSGKSYAQYRVDKSLAKKTLEDQLVLSLRLRTMQPTGNLMYAAGKVDYNILEISNGMVQYRFDLGSGEGMVRVSSIYVSDGQWHEVKLERDSNSARLTVDGKHVAHGSAPGVNDILNLQSDDLYLGAEVRQHPSVLGFEDIQRGFTGCLDDVRISRVSVPLHMSGASSVAVLKRFANVEFSCDAATVLVPLGVCGSQPCLNGGTCTDLNSESFNCHCHARFAGRLCEIDTDPCASSPCLYGGRCKVVPSGGDYLCDCAPRMTGKRCEYGRYCLPNPCRHGGVCEEGDTGPICKCRGFAGTLCELDIDECLTSPCATGATCINDPGTYKCVCPPNMTGLNCGNPLYSTPITSSIYSITWEELIGIIVAITIIILIVCLFIIYRKFRIKRSREHANNINNDTRKDIVHNSMSPRSHELAEFKRSSKMSNLEVIQRSEIQCPPRPASYTPSSNNEQPYSTCNATVMLNNLDTLRSYGSAGDELENVPPDYLRNLNRNTTQQSHNNGGAISDSDSLHKPSWSEQMHLQTFTDNKINNDLKRQNPPDPPTRVTPSIIRSGIIPGRLNGSASPSMNVEDDGRMVGGYHWDCSDWVRPSQNPLPNITEVPGSEVPDSSSFHSNESNESHPRQHNHLPPVIGPVDSSRDIETLNEDKESEYIGDSECDEHSEQHLSLGYDHDHSLGLNPLDSGSEEYPFSTENSYMRHPDQYLPQYNIHSETDGENAPLTGRLPLNGLDGRPHRIEESDDEDVEPYGFPLHHHKRRNRRQANDLGSVITTLGEHNSLLGHGTSNSDLSTNLCEIDDSECEQETKQLNWPIGVQQTSV